MNRIIVAAKVLSLQPRGTMNKLKKSSWAVCVAALVSAVTFAAGPKATPSQAAPNVKQTDIKYEQPFGDNGPSVGQVEGKWGDGHPASMFIIFKAGQQGGWHFHHFDYKAIVLKGIYTEQQLAQPMEDLPPGTWVLQPAIQPHRNGCKAGGDDCLIYIYFPHSADAVLTDEHGKPVPAAADSKKGAK
jgi:quercetin dioxygenase-like cupin family protein